MKRIAPILLSLSVLILSCNKEPGEGGTSSITGKVYTYDLNSTGLDTLDEYYVMGEDVYIIYGLDDNTYNDKFSTSFDGSYRFDNLTEGKYTIFAYSRCLTCSGEVEEEKIVIDITAKKTEYTAPDLIILK